MGYYTNYEITITGFDESVGADLTRSSKWFAFSVNDDSHWGSCVSYGSEVASTSMVGAKWYDWEKDLLKVSKDFPELLFEVVGDGEESGDNWKARIQNGKSEVVKAELVFPEFKEVGVTQ